MIERVHEHIISELQQNARTDTVFILTAILLNLLSLGVNSGIASSSDEGNTKGIVFAAFISLVLVVNFVVINGLRKGREMRNLLIGGLLKMYEDQHVQGYYDASLLTGYNKRYGLFILAVVFTGVIAVIVPIALLGG